MCRQDILPIRAMVGYWGQKRALGPGFYLWCPIPSPGLPPRPEKPVRVQSALLIHLPPQLCGPSPSWNTGLRPMPQTAPPQGGEWLLPEILSKAAASDWHRQIPFETGGFMSPWASQTTSAPWGLC